MDEQAMAWVTQRPEDWQLGGLCDVYVWGSGRRGELGEAGRNTTTPVSSSSLSCAQQVWLHPFDNIHIEHLVLSH